ncbi:putative membrane protein [Providencia alcalifaciens]|nr:putative membrane protein [Providencia alcalifaciens]
MDFTSVFSALLSFVSYFAIGTVMVLIFLFIYTRISRHNEWVLIKENNTAAGVAFIGAMLGYITPLSSAISNSVSILDCIIWGVIALIIQLLVLGATKIYIPTIGEKIKQNNISAGLFLGGTSLGFGILNAVSMSY